MVTRAQIEGELEAKGLIELRDEDEEGKTANKSSDGRDGKASPTSKESNVRKKELSTEEQGDANFSRVKVELLDFDWIFDAAEDGT